ncbi:DUF1836 domain-containing protein [Clostridiaceae bacterium]|nr:DUF1836 domain-containing protein [Lachnospiraceae bacterium]NBH18680.1 DUF1836 domain-containing protein [Clostridiaceae bacterium]NBH34309.1 DUF1836 domain-containing protein [Clostridiaceae bacterium]
MKKNEELLTNILARLDNLSYIKLDKIPEIDLYMDQVTSFMEDHLQKTKRNPEDKALTKTMINNYAKNRLLPPPVKKKYSREHILLLLFIYYYKNLLSFSDIEQLFGPITEKYFGSDSKLSLSHIYEEVFALENNQMERLKEDTLAKFNAAKSTFGDIDEEEREYLQLFAFISELSFDVYLKKQMIEILIDQLREETSETKNGKKKKEKTNG